MTSSEDENGQKTAEGNDNSSTSTMGSTNDATIMAKLQQTILEMAEALKEEKKQREDLVRQFSCSSRPAMQPKQLFVNDNASIASTDSGSPLQLANSTDSSLRFRNQETERRRKLVARFSNKSCVFDGSKEPLEFLEKFNYISRCEEMTDEEKKKVFPSLLEGTAATWFEQNVGFNNGMSWEKVLEKFEANFQMYSSRIQAGFDLDRLRRKNGQSIVEFVKEFERLCSISKGPRTKETDPFWTTELYRKLPVYLREKIFLKHKTTYDILKEKVFVVGSAADEIYSEKMEKKKNGRNREFEDRNGRGNSGRQHWDRKEPRNSEFYRNYKDGDRKEKDEYQHQKPFDKRNETNTRFISAYGRDRYSGSDRNQGFKRNWDNSNQFNDGNRRENNNRDNFKRDNFGREDYRRGNDRNSGGNRDFNSGNGERNSNTNWNQDQRKNKTYEVKSDDERRKRRISESSSEDDSELERTKLEKESAEAEYIKMPLVVSNIRMNAIVDTGADVSLMNKSILDKYRMDYTKKSSSILGVGEKKSKVWGNKMLSVEVLGIKRKLIFKVTDLGVGEDILLGMDSIKKLSIVVDPRMDLIINPDMETAYNYRTGRQIKWKVADFIALQQKEKRIDI